MDLVTVVVQMSEDNAETLRALVDSGESTVFSLASVVAGPAMSKGAFVASVVVQRIGSLPDSAELP